MSTSLSPPASPAAASRQPPTPQATTAAILGASSNGWSPLRLQKKSADSFEPSALRVGAEDDSQHPSSQSPKKQTQNFASLRSHGLVSNSIFLQQATSSQSLYDAGSPARNPHSPAAPSPSSAGRTSVGLGIGVSSSPSRIPMTRRAGPSPRKTSRETTPSYDENRAPSDVFGPINTAPSRDRLNSPRKSKGFEVLQRSSYVTNSPFKQVENRHEETPNLTSSPPRTADLTSSPWQTEDETPSAAPAGMPDTPPTPSSKGLLVSNRLHGPRTMENSPVRPDLPAQVGPRQRQRRKTVTFDEILDVQEFDKESSFDVESTRSDDASFDSEGGGSVNDEDDAMWLAEGHADEDSLAELEDNLRNTHISGKLQIRNGGPEPTTPDLHDDAGSDDVEPELSCDSRDTSSVEDEPSSPLLRPMPSPHRQLSGADASFDKTFATADTNVSMDESIDDRDFNSSYSGLRAADRVDSLVDELLNEEILHSPTQRAGSPGDGASAELSEPAKTVVQEEPNTEAKRPVEITQAALPAVRSMQATIHQAPVTDAPGSTSSSQPSAAKLSAPAADGQAPAHERGLPVLPQWSPLTLGEDLGAGAFSPLQMPTTPQLADGDRHASPSKRPGSVRGRPHISRNDILQRVAREKQQQHSQDKERDAAEARPAIQQPGAATQRLPRGSEPGVRPQRSFEASLDDVVVRPIGTHPRPSAPTSRENADPIVATAARPQPPPSPVKDMHNVESPLEKLGSAYVSAAEANSGSADADDGVVRADKLLQPPAADDLELRGPSNGRLSPSTLGAPPPPLTPAQQAEQIIQRRRSKNKDSKGRRKRSMSTGDEGPVFTAARSTLLSPSPVDEESSEESSAESEPAELPNRQSITADLAKSKALLDVSLQKAMDTGFSTNLEMEIGRIYRDKESSYKINDRGLFKGVDDKVSHSTSAGDVDSGKAWRKLRRPSDMNEYAREMREYRQNENPKRASGKVFVMVDSFTPANLPVPAKPTYFHCVLDNGLHMVKTATAPLRSGTPSKIAQEFELIQHKNLAFSLTLVVQRDAHLREPERPSSPSGRREQTSPTLKAFSRFFTSPRKQAAKRLQQEQEEAAQMAAQASRAEPMLSYINREGAFGRTKVVFEKVAANCHAKCLVLELPVYGASDAAQSMSGPSSLAGRGDTLPSPFAADFSRNLSKVRGTLRLKLFYLPAMPAIPRDKLPENIGECIRGMQNAVWHRSAPWQEGVLTQMGGDCLSWRRRPVKAQGQFLVCYSEITKKPTVKIDLSKAVSVEVNAESRSSRIIGHSDGRASRSTVRSVSLEEDPDANYEVERSFRVTFADGERIHFFADTDEEKERWVDVLSNIIESPIPPNPLWAQMALESISQSAQPSSNIPRLAGPVQRQTSKQLREGRKAPPAVAEESPNAKADRTPDRKVAVTSNPASTPAPAAAPATQGSVASGRSVTGRAPLPSHLDGQGSARSTPSKLPMATTPHAQVRPQLAGPPVPQKGPAMSVPRPVVHDPAGNVAFDRLRRAAANRSEGSHQSSR